MTKFSKARKLIQKFVIDTGGVLRQDLQTKFGHPIMTTLCRLNETSFGQKRASPMHSIIDNSLLAAWEELSLFFVSEAERISDLPSNVSRSYFPVRSSPENRQHECLEVGNGHGITGKLRADILPRLKKNFSAMLCDFPS